jgi:hypothetical protein
VQDAEDGNAGLHQKFPVAIKEAASTRRPIGFLEHQASLIVARNDIAQVIDRLPGERENPHVAERVSTQLQAPGGVLQEYCLAALLDD